MNPRNFFAELKRRNVYKVAVAYAVVGWLIMQVAATVVPALHLSDAITSTVVVVVILGFPLALVFAWAFEITPEGIRRTTDVIPNESIRRRMGRTLNGVIIGVLVLVISVLVFDRTRRRPANASASAGKSIAVLPFADMSQAKDQEYFCDGISEEILDSLAKVDGLRVVARTSAFSFKGKNTDVSEVGRKLNVDHVLEGSLRREGNRIRVAVQLVNARDGFHMWSQTFEHELQGVFALQDEITRAVVDALKIKLAVAPLAHKKSNTEAYDLYLKGRYFLNRKTQADAERAIDYFQQTLAKDPNNAPAYAGLADSYSSLVFPLGAVAPREVMPKAKEAALRALAIDNALGEAHASLAYITFFYDWDWVAAERDFKRALELNPNNADTHHWYSHYLMGQGRIEESLTQSKRALELSPFEMLMNVHLAWHCLYARQYDQALDHIEKAIEMDSNFAQAYPWLGLILEQKGRYDEAIAAFQKAIKLFPGGSSIAEAELAHAYAVSGKREAALKIIDELRELAKTNYVSSFQVAAIYAGLGDKDQAFAWLEKAHEERSDGLVNLRAEQRFDSLRPDPRFADLLRRIGLDSQNKK